MAKKPKRPAAGAGSARQKAAASQSRQRSRADFALAALREVTSPNHAFTMKDEARNTGHRSSLWGGDTRLRAKPIGFVSAGLIEPLKKDESQAAQDDAPSEGLVDDVIATDDAALQLRPDTLAVEEETSPALEVPLQSLDLSGSPTSPAPAAAPAAERSASDRSSQAASIGFVIDVKGDKKLAAQLINSTPHIPDVESIAEESDSSSEVILFKGRGNTIPSKNSVEQKRAEKTVFLDTIHYEIQSDVTKGAPDRAVPCSSARLDRQQKPDNFMDSDDEEAAIIADYIANMAEDSGDDVGEPPSRLSLLNGDLGGDTGHFGNFASESSVSSDDSAASGDDDEDENAINGDMADGHLSDSDRLASPTIDDETLARLLGKQEELGMGSDKLILASDTVGNQGSTPRGKSRRGKGVNARMQGAFASASAVADAFDDLDLMDWQRPSLQNQRKRGRRGQPPVFGLSDSEMEQNLQTAWQNDRESKKSRKIRREELRSQGLLGKHADPDDPRLRYPTGMTLEDIKSEFRAFLQGSEQRLELPPMHKSARKTLHLIARQFKVKSQSTGSGTQRRPTLIRTKYTASYTEEHLEIAMSGVGSKHFPRLDLKGKGKATQKSRGGGGNSAVTYQEGEVVGASAPELGQENKGRTMLEKMGWSIGMGLGTLDNKGILQPVAHVVKRTKAGLG
ncbi:hypothetical protein GE09DRAFT_1044698 [Coniochaeta sp. 2T2.1]|nr:hypothetical protein GE09DRAFT_1044698 [Coniochaeta sp. 2T2.1]